MKRRKPIFNLHSSSAGDLAVSKTLEKKVIKNKTIDRSFNGHFRIIPGLRIEGSSAKGGQCPDVLFEDFKLNGELESTDPEETFCDRCKQITGTDIDKINAVLDMVIKLIIKKPIDDNGKTFYGSDYKHPHWQNAITRKYRDEKKPMPIGEFVRLGFGDCRICNGLLAFGLQQAGLDASYSYKIIKSQYIDSTGDYVAQEYDHALCIVVHEGQRFVADAYSWRYNGQRLDKLSKSKTTIFTPQDLAIGTSDLYQWRKTIDEHSRIINPSLDNIVESFKKTNNFPASNIKQPAISPYLDHITPRIYKG